MQNQPKVLALCCTKNRHYSLERSVRFFLEQTYPNAILLIYNNSCIPQRLNSNLPSNIVLINNCLSYSDKKKYTNLGDIYKDALTHVSNDTDLVTFWDDDDIFLPNHIEQGVKGYLKGKSINSNYIAYKPKKSFFRSSHKIELVENTLEPSIFVELNHLKQYGFSQTTGPQHLQWVQPLLNNQSIFIDFDGIPTLCYNWGDDFFAWKTSGDTANPANFANYEKYSEDIGDQIITPLSKKEIENYYNQIK